MNPVVYMLKPGEFLFREGEASNGVYIVRQGEVEIFLEREGSDITLSTLHAGDVIGTMTIFSREARTASARAHTAVQVVHVGIETVEGSFKNLPVWVQAVLKDSVARLKASNDQLVEVKLNERKMQQRVGTRFHAASQFAAFLGYGIRVGLIKDEGIELFPLKGVVERCELILQQKADFLEGVLTAFIKGSLIKVRDDKKWGRSIEAPQAALLEDFAQFTLQSVKTDTAGFIPVKYQLLVTSLVRLAKKDNAKEYCTRAECIELLSKESGRKVTDEVFNDLLKFRMITQASGADRCSWSAKSLQRRLIFESTFRCVKDLSGDLSGTEVAAPQLSQRAG